MMDSWFFISIFGFQMTTKKDNDVETSGILDLERYVGDMPLTFILLVCNERAGDDIVLAVPPDVYSKAEFFLSIVEVRTAEIQAGTTFIFG